MRTNGKIKSTGKELTPSERQPKLAAALGISELYFKREDLHPYGSHKGRSIPVMIELYRETGTHDFAISSSGNAALAAALYVRECNARNRDGIDKPISLDIYVGNHIAPHKLEKLKVLEDERIRVLKRERPLQALGQAIEEGRTSLRQSTDDLALAGYEPLAEELAAIKRIGAVFMGASSGTTAQALSAYFLENKLPIQMHIVQTSSCHPLADAFDNYESLEDRSLADAIVDRTALRKNALTPLIRESGGRGWCASNEDIETALELAKKNTSTKVSPNSALSIAGAMQAAYTGYEIKGAVVCLICGE